MKIQNFDVRKMDMELLVKEVRLCGLSEVFLIARTHNIASCPRYGFVVHGAAFKDASLPHRHMTCRMT